MKREALAVPSIMLSVSILSVLMLSIGVCSYYGISLIVAFSIGVIPVALLGVHRGGDILTLLKHALASIWRIRTLFVIIAFMGISIAMWLSSGAVAFLMTRGEVLTRGVFFLPAAFTVCALSSLCIGTALGTFSTIGLAFYGMGKSAGIPEDILVGTLVSGVFIADRLAPMSGLVNLTMNKTGIAYPEYFKHSWKRSASVILLCLIAYGVIGGFLPKIPGASPQSAMETITSQFHESWLLWLMPLLTFGLAVAGVPAVWTLFVGIVAGFGFTVHLQSVTLTEGLRFVMEGYADKAGVLNGGGLAGVSEVLGIVALAVVYNEMLASTGITLTLLNNIEKGVRSLTALKRRIGLFSIALTSLTCDQTVGILLPIEAMKPFVKDGRMTAVESAALVADTGTLIAPLEFWNVNALVIMALTGVPAWKYGPWAIFCWLVPLTALLFPGGSLFDIMRTQSKLRRIPLE